MIESGSTLEYFTGIQWRRSERITAAIITANGKVMVVTPHFEEPSIRETLQVDGDVRPWDEHENPFEKLVQCLKDSGVREGVVAAESTIRFFIVEGVRRASGLPFVSACECTVPMSVPPCSSKPSQSAA